MVVLNHYETTLNHHDISMVATAALSEKLHFRGIEVQKLLQGLQAQGRIWQKSQ